MQEFAPRATPDGAAPRGSGSTKAIRVGLLALAIVLSALAIWTAAPDLLLSDQVGLPTTRQSAAALRASRTWAGVAAAIGAIRGPLWAADAYADAGLAWLDGAGDLETPSPPALDAATATAERAVALAPLQAETWLFLAGLAERRGAPARAATELEMAFYTDPENADLALLRLSVAAGLEIAPDAELLDLLRHDVGLAPAGSAAARRVLVAAWRAASPASRAALRAALGDLDPQLFPDAPTDGKP